jgi:hypothetical protein
MPQLTRTQLGRLANVFVSLPEPKRLAFQAAVNSELRAQGLLKPTDEQLRVVMEAVVKELSL